MPAFAISRLPIGAGSRPWLLKHTEMAISASRASRSHSTAARLAKLTPSSIESPRDNKPPAVSAAALRTAEARESALRAARLRRQGQEQDRRAEEEKKAQEKRDYEARYKAAGRKWISSIIALPILLVTSYYLFDRLVLGHAPKELPKFKDKDSWEKQ